MLKKKEYTAILKSAKSKDEIVNLYRKSYSPIPAIRIIKQEYQHGLKDRLYTLLCDKCGHIFSAKEPDNIEYRKESCVCPACGFSMEYKPKTYYEAKTQYALNEAYKGYNCVLSNDGELLEPTFVVFESVMYEESAISSCEDSILICYMEM